MNKYLCPICGFLLDVPPADYNICPSCGVEFGSDTVEWTYQELQRGWIDRGMEWTSRVIPRPPHYNPLAQLGNVSLRFGDSANTVQEIPTIAPKKPAFGTKSVSGSVFDIMKVQAVYA